MAHILRMPNPSDYITMSTWVADAYECIRWAGPKLSFPLNAKNLSRLLAGPETTSYLLCHSDHPEDPLGFGQLVKRVPAGMHLARIIVSPASRGGGLVRILCERLIERTNAVSEVRQLTLNVYRDNRQAMALYLSLGFTEIPGQSRQGLVAMHKTLR